MKWIVKPTIFFLLILLNIHGFSQNSGLSELVDPFIGTGGHGHTYPGAVYPFGMVQLSSDTRLTGWDGCSAYHYADSITYGFSHTHLSGTGVPDYGDILLMPYTGKPALYEKRKIGSAFRHKNETASPGFYSVRLDDYNVFAELTSTPRCGMHRYTFMDANASAVLIDLIHRDFVVDSYIKIKNEYQIEGYRISSAWAKDQRIYFSARFSLPIKQVKNLISGKSIGKLEGMEMTGDSIRLSLGFDLEKGDQLLIKIGLSAVSIDGARENLRTEIPNWDFNQVQEDAKQAWDKQLSKIEVFGGSKKDQTIFYTALYHTMIVPNLFSDADGSYRGLDGQIYRDSSRESYTVFSLWDTYRATHPLYTLLERKRTADFINTMLAHYDQTGLLPVWELAGNETNCMIGTHGVSVITDAMKKGISGFDYERAFEAMRSSLEQDKHELNVLRAQGYIPSNEVNESVSKTLEYAYDFWCLAQAARILGKDEDYRRNIQRAQYYKNIFNPETGFMRPKLNADWLSPFDPKQVDFNFTEANSWQYSFYVPQDMKGLIQLMGGDGMFELKLDELFTTDSQISGRHQADITGLIGQYAHGNEPSHHMAYLYNYIGKPWKSQTYLSQIMHNLYSARPDGYAGNEDCGQMSAWYVFSALGFYPVTPGSNNYILGKPLFKRAILNFEDGNYFIIECDQPQGGQYIRSVQLNKKPYNTSYIKHEDIIKGGKLAFYLGQKPSNTFGVDPKFRPISSIDDHQIVMVPILKNAQSSFTDEYTIKLMSYSDDQIYYSLRKGNRAFKKWKQYTEPIQVDYTGAIAFYAVNEDGEESQLQESAFTKVDHQWSIELENSFSPQYTGGGEKGLINGIRGGRSFSDGSWQGFQGHDFIATVDLGEQIRISKVTIGFLQSQKSWIWFPQSIELYISQDGDNFTLARTLEFEGQEKVEDTILKDFELNMAKQKVRFIKIKAKNRGVCPKWHPGAGGKAWLFVDEIMIK